MKFEKLPIVAVEVEQPDQWGRALVRTTVTCKSGRTYVLPDKTESNFKTRDHETIIRREKNTYSKKLTSIS